jgi:hypothetical protein
LGNELKVDVGDSRKMYLLYFSLGGIIYSLYSNNLRAARLMIMIKLNVITLTASKDSGTASCTKTLKTILQGIEGLLEEDEDPHEAKKLSVQLFSASEKDSDGWLKIDFYFQQHSYLIRVAVLIHGAKHPIQFRLRKISNLFLDKAAATFDAYIQIDDSFKEFCSMVNAKYAAASCSGSTSSAHPPITINP